VCGIDLVEVRVVARTAVQRRHVLANRSLPQPYAFDLRQVTHQAQQGQRRWGNRSSGKLLARQTGTYVEQRHPLPPEVALEDATVVAGHRAVNGIGDDRGPRHWAILPVSLPDE